MFQDDLAGRTVLIVEDEYLLARELADHVEKAGARVIGPMPSLVFAFEALQHHLPDLAILDIRLGSGDVFSLAHHLRDLDVPFLFATAYASSVPASFGDVDVLEKPVALTALSRSLVKLLNSPSEFRSGRSDGAQPRSSLWSIEAADNNEALLIAQRIADETGQKVTILDENMIEIDVVSSPKRN
ncbi:response regulator [Tardiphaga sp.]|uniref:response regulator n=1 Tax=Tardiphaga sp. TaxID=1926292 RepID=UPI0037DA2565